MESPLASSRDGDGMTRSRIACYATIAACLPYITLQVLWLSGQPVGGRTAEGRAELLDRPHRVGNVITLGLTLAQIALVLAFSYGWGRRILDGLAPYLS